MERLNDLELQEIEEEQEVQQRFAVKDIDSANWALRKLKAINDKEAEVKYLASKELERINNWQTKELEKYKNNKDFFEMLLLEYYSANKIIDPKFKLSTPYGKVSSRKQQPQWNYDNDKVIEWLNINNKDLVRVKYEPIKTDIKKLYKAVGGNVVTEQGEIVDGITVEEKEDSMIIKVEG